MSSRAYGYIRVSTDGQVASGLGLQAQRAAIVDYCHRRGLNLADVISDDGVGGAIPFDLRPGGAELCAIVRPGDHLVMRFDRAFRGGILPAIAQTDSWKKQEVILHFVDKQIDTSTRIGDLMISIFAWLAELELEAISERTIAALQAKVARGGTANGEIAYGYQPDGRGGCIEDERAIASIGYMLAMHQGGAGRGGVSRKTIADNLNEMGFRTPKGKLLNKHLVLRTTRRAHREGYPPTVERCMELFRASDLACVLGLEDQEILLEL